MIERDKILRAARAVEEHANGLAEASATLRAAVDEARKEAYRVAGDPGVTDLEAAGIHVDKVLDEIAGVLRANGLQPLLDRGRSNLAPVVNLVARWERRLDEGRLTTTRPRRPPDMSADRPIEPQYPGQKITGQTDGRPARHPLDPKIEQLAEDARRHRIVAHDAALDNPNVTQRSRLPRAAGSGSLSRRRDLESSSAGDDVLGAEVA